MVAQVQKRVGSIMRIKGRPTKPIPGNAVRDRITSILASSAGQVTPPSDTFLLGYTKPDASNTGPRIAFGDAQVVAGTSGKVTYGTAGQTITGKVFTCQVFVTAANVTFRDCWFLGSTITTYLGAGLVDTRSATNARVEYCEITAYYGGQDRTRAWLNGVTGKSVTVYRCNIHDVTDGFGATGNAVFQGNYVHDLSHHSDDSDHSSDSLKPYWTHNDGIQFTTCTDFLVEGNNFDMGFSPDSGSLGNPSGPAASHGVPNPGEWIHAHGLLIGPRSGNITNLRVTRNWFGKATYLIQITTQGRGFDSGNNGSFTGNRVYTGQTGYSSQQPCQIVYAASVGTFTGLNTTVYADDDLLIPAGWRGKPIQNPTGAYTYRFNSTLSAPN